MDTLITRGDNVDFNSEHKFFCTPPLELYLLFFFFLTIFIYSFEDHVQLVQYLLIHKQMINMLRKSDNTLLSRNFILFHIDFINCKSNASIIPVMVYELNTLCIFRQVVKK